MCNDHEAEKQKKSMLQSPRENILCFLEVESLALCLYLIIIISIRLLPLQGQTNKIYQRVVLTFNGGGRKDQTSTPP